MSHVYEMMNLKVVSVNPDNTLEDVAEILDKNKISGVPVVNNDNKVIGMISSRDLYNYSEKLNLVPLVGFSAWLYPNKKTAELDSYEERTKKFMDTAVKDIMSKEIVTVKENNTWHHAATLMKQNGVNRLPVTDEEGILKGIITRNDLIYYLSDKEG